MTNDEDDDLLQAGEWRLDFSEFHALDHSILECLRDGDARANRFGGVRVHVRYAWAYRWGPELAGLTLCKVGHHARVVRQMRDDVTEPFTRSLGCANCGCLIQTLRSDDDDDDG